MATTGRCHRHQLIREGATAMPWGSENRALTLGLLLTASAWAFETLAVATILPATVAEFCGLSLYGWAFSAFLLANLLIITVAGGEIDRLGPLRPFLAGIALFMAGLLIAGLAQSMVVLIVGRAVQGAGCAILSAVTYAIVGRGYPESARPRMLALLSSAWVLPGLTGPAVAGIVADAIGWRWVFFGIVPIAILAALLVTPALRHLPSRASSAPDWSRARNAALLSIGMGLLLAGLGMQDHLAAVALTIAGATALLVALRALMPRGTWRAAPGAPAALAVMGLLSLGFYGAEAFIPLLLTDVRNQPTAFGGLPLTASAMTWTAGAWLLDRRGAGVEPGTLARAGLALIACGIVGVGFVLMPSTSVWLAPVSWAIGGLGVGLAYATCQLVTLQTTPAVRMGRATSSLQLIHTAAIALATGIGGALIAHFGTRPETLPTALTLQGALMLSVVVIGICIAGRLSLTSTVASEATSTEARSSALP